MANFLRAGAISDNWNDPNLVSMAKDIENALKLMVQLPSDDDPGPRRQLFIAIATGVINHLQANANAFVTQVPNIVGSTVGASPSVEVHP